MRGTLSSKYWNARQVVGEDKKPVEGQFIVSRTNEEGQFIEEQVEARSNADAKLVALKTFGGTGAEVRGLKNDPHIGELMAYLTSLAPAPKPRRKKGEAAEATTEVSSTEEVTGKKKARA